MLAMTRNISPPHATFATMLIVRYLWAFGMKVKSRLPYPSTAETDVNCLRLQITDKTKTAPPPNIIFHAHVQVTFKVWRPSNFVTFFGIKKPKICCNIDKF